MWDRDVAAGGQDKNLRSVVLEIERHVSADGWDGPLRVFALVRVAEAIRDDPDVRDRLPEALAAAADADPDTLTAVEQEDLPPGDDVEQVLAQISWPTEVAGAAVCLERIVVPPQAEQDLPDDPHQAVHALLAHPDRQDVRLAVGVLRDGTASCAVRSRSHDSDAAVGTGPDVAPGVVAALLATFDPVEQER